MEQLCKRLSHLGDTAVIAGNSFRHLKPGMSTFLIQRHRWGRKIGIGETTGSDPDHERDRLRHLEVDVAATSRAEMEHEVVPPIARPAIDFRVTVYGDVGHGEPGIQMVARPGTALAELAMTHEDVLRFAGYNH